MLNGIALFSQNLQLSRYYAGGSKRVPLQILNTHPDYFYVLRYNREVHDFIIEKRGKPNAELLHIYPIKLDSVNARWFDYEELDYLLFEKDRKLCFVFQKILNNQRSVFLKQIDTLGHMSGFTQVLSINKEPQYLSFDITMSLSKEQNIQLIQRQESLNQAVRKQVYLYEPSEKKMLWRKTLPIENMHSGSSLLHTCDQLGNLYYLQVFATIVGYQRKYSTSGQLEVPLIVTDSVKLMVLDAEQKLSTTLVPTGGMWAFHAAQLDVQKNIVCALRYTAADSAQHKPKFLVCAWQKDLSVLLFAKESQLRDDIAEKLKYYDGSDDASSSAKVFRGLVNCPRNDNTMWEERVDGNYFKELLVWQWNEKDGSVTQQYLIPRRIFFFPNRTPFRQLGEVAVVTDNVGASCFLLESRANKAQEPSGYSHKNFAKQTQLRHGSLMQYRLENGTLKKRTLFENDEFDMVPIRYVGWDQDFVFYLNKSRAEKFAILKDCPF